MSPVGIGHNSEMSETDQRVLFMHHYNKIVAARAIVDEAKREEKKLRKLAKADGLVLADIDAAMCFDNIEDGNIVVEELQRRVRIARWFNLPVGTQVSIFDDGPAEDTAYDKGMTAALKGISLVNPYDPSVPQHKKFNEGYHEGQKAARERLKEIMEANNAAASIIAGSGDGDDDDDTDDDADEFGDEIDSDEFPHPDPDAVH